MLKKTTLRERIMILVLAVIVVYYIGVQMPVASMTEKVETEQAQVTTQLDEAQDKVMRKAQMEKKLQSYKSLGSDTSITPAYDNTNNIITEMNSILGGAQNYTITFGEESRDKHIVRQDISLQFAASSFDSAVNKLRKIETSRNCYLLNDTAISEGNGGDDSRFTVVVNFTSFEYEE